MDKKREWRNGNDAMTHAIRILDGTIPEYNDKAPRFRNIDMTVEESLILLPLNSGVCHGVSH